MNKHCALNNCLPPALHSPRSATTESAACSGGECSACSQAGAPAHACARCASPDSADSPQANARFWVTSRSLRALASRLACREVAGGPLPGCGWRGDPARALLFHLSLTQWALAQVTQSHVPSSHLGGGYLITCMAAARDPELPPDRLMSRALDLKPAFVRACGTVKVWAFEYGCLGIERMP